MRVLVSAHQPNFLPGISVIEKLEQADMVIWLDEVQYTKGGFTNRNRMPDGSWLTVPVDKPTDGMPVNRVRIADMPRWRERAQRTLRQHYGDHELIEAVCDELSRPYRLLVGVNVAILRLLLDTPACFQSHLDGGHAVTAVSEDETKLAPISNRLAMMVAELGGTTYLSGPSGFRYLNEQPFVERGIEVRYFDWHATTNPCALERVRPRRVSA